MAGSCDYCDKEAKVHLTQLVGGQVKKVALCDSCAAEKGVTDPTGFALAEMLGGESAPAPGPTPKPSSGGSRSCPGCGFTLDDLKRIRRFGCSRCYETFREEVSRMLSGMHKGVQHCGKVPEGLMEQFQRNKRLEDLRQRLEHAIDAENYEEAAGLRDEIRRLDSQEAEAGSD